MSVYSTTPGPPARIRIVAHPPLGPLRAWLPLPTFSPSTHEAATIKDLLQSLRAMLRTSSAVTVELEGFALFEDSPLSILDPANDILDVKILQSADERPPPETEPSLASAKLAQNVNPASIPLPASSSVSTTDTSASSSSSSSSASSSSDSDEAGPEVLPSKRPLPADRGTNDSPRLTKRRKRARDASASGPTFPSPSPSSSDSSGSSSSSESSESDNDQASGNPPARHPLPVVPGSEQKLVAPGAGLNRTRKRNLRKRVLKMAKAKERRERQEATTENVDLAAKSTAGQDRQPDAGRSASAAAATRTTDAGGTGEADGHKRPADDSLTATTQSSASSRTLPRSRRDPYSDYAATTAQLASPTQTLLRNGSEPGISLVGPGRGNLRQTRAISENKSEDASRGGRKVTASTRASPSYTPASPNYSPPTPPPPPPAVSRHIGADSETPAVKKPDTVRKQYADRFPFPNQRTDLPPWMVVTSVNVERKGWEAGIGKRVKGTSKGWAGWSAPPLQTATTSEAPNGRSETSEAQTGTDTYSSKRAVEEGWDRFRKVYGLRDTQVGAKIAVKVLELDPVTFNPTLSLKFGRLASPSPDSPLRIQLHSSCLTAGDEEEAAAANYYQEEEEELQQAEEEVEREEADCGLKKKMKFGQDAFEDVALESDGIWEGDWSGDVRLLE